MYKCMVPVLKVRNEGFSSLYRGFFPTWTRLVSSHSLTHVHTHSHVHTRHLCTHPLTQCTHTLTHVHTHSHMYMPTHTCTHPLTHVHTHSHMYTHTHMYTPTHTFTHPHFTGSMVNDILDNSRADQDISRN